MTPSIARKAAPPEPIGLKQYIRDVGVDVCAARFGVSVHTVRSWLRSGHYARFPDRKTARHIMRCAPEITWDAIYPDDA